MNIIEKLDSRLAYKETLILNRDEFKDLQEYISEYDNINDDLKKEIETLEGVNKQLNQAREILDGIIECIDDEGVVTPGDQKHLAKRLAVAIKFVENLE